MQVRRVFRKSVGIEVQARHDGEQAWRVCDDGAALGYPSPFTAAWELERLARAGARDEDVLLPFQPLSFRDFMVFERHVVDAGRGYARRFLPAASRLARGYEAVTRRTFPSFRPARLWYQQPIYYMSNAMTFVASGTPIEFPAYSQALDYELELGFVLKHPLYNASPAEAEQAIGGFVVLCDFSARDVQLPEMRSGFGPQKSKHFISSLASTAVTADGILPGWRDLTGSVTVNGTVVERPSTATARYSLGEILAHASASERLHPGELFGTGTLPGGSGMETHRWLVPGDTVQLEIDGVGRIEHTLIASGRG